MKSNNIIEKYDRPLEYTGALFNFFIALQFFLIWYSPEEKEAQRIIELATLMAFEFILVHSGVFMAILPKKYSLWILVPFYGLFALAFNAMINGWLIIITYLVAIFNRMRFAFADVSGSIKTRSIIYSIGAVIIYFVLTMVVAFSEESIPALGITEAYMDRTNYTELLDGAGGLFLEVPQTALCLGVVYYFFIGLLQLKLINTSFSNRTAVSQLFSK